VKKAYAVAIQRPSPPLTNLSDEDDRTAELKEKLKELENMRRDLALIRNGTSGEENRAAGRFDTPDITLVMSAKYCFLECPRRFGSMQRA